MQAAAAISEDLSAVLGIVDPAIRIGGNQSGKALQAERQQSDTATFNFYDNLTRSMAQVGRILVDLVPSYYAEPGRIVRIIGDDKPGGTVHTAAGSIRGQCVVVRAEAERAEAKAPAVKPHTDAIAGAADTIDTEAVRLRRRHTDLLSEALSKSSFFRFHTGSLLLFLIFVYSNTMASRDSALADLKLIAPPKLCELHAAPVSRVCLDGPVLQVFCSAVDCSGGRTTTVRCERDILHFAAAVKAQILVICNDTSPWGFQSLGLPPAGADDAALLARAAACVGHELAEDQLREQMRATIALVDAAPGNFAGPCCLCRNAVPPAHPFSHHHPQPRVRYAIITFACAATAPTTTLPSESVYHFDFLLSVPNG
jgi:hypothetical protein